MENLQEDALFFNLYGIDEYDADYILSTFPIVRKQDESDQGRFLTRDLILAYMRALRVGETEVRVGVLGVGCITLMVSRIKD